MNYSASEDYHDKCRKFDRKLIDRNKIQKHWFNRNFYVLYQSKGYFIHNTFVMEFGTFDPNQYSGDYYGPFFESTAKTFAKNLRAVHDDFVLGG